MDKTRIVMHRSVWCCTRFYGDVWSCVELYGGVEGCTVFSYIDYDNILLSLKLASVFSLESEIKPDLACP